MTSVARREAYPLTTSLERTVDITVPDVHRPTCSKLVEVFGEYEHGAADIEDLGVSLKGAHDLLQDFFLTLTDTK